MERAVYCVVESRDVWVIRLNGKEYGPCPSRDHALNVALRAAARAQARGCYTQVIAREGRHFRTVWLNGREVLPAAA
jgi:hypothetical protein